MKENFDDLRNLQGERTCFRLCLLLYLIAVILLIFTQLNNLNDRI